MSIQSMPISPKVVPVEAFRLLGVGAGEPPPEVSIPVSEYEHLRNNVALLEAELETLKRQGAAERALALDKIAKKSMTPAAYRQRLLETLDEMGLDPTKELVKILQEGVIDTDQRLKILFNLQELVVPKMRSIDVTGDLDVSITVNIQRFGREIPLEQRVQEAKAADQALMRQINRSIDVATVTDGGGDDDAGPKVSLE